MATTYASYRYTYLSTTSNQPAAIQYIIVPGLAWHLTYNTVSKVLITNRRRSERSGGAKNLPPAKLAL